MDLKRIPTKGLITNVEMDLSKFIEKFTKVGIIYSLTELLLGLAMFTGFFYMSFENVKEEAPFNPSNLDIVIVEPDSIQTPDLVDL